MLEAGMFKMRPGILELIAGIAVSGVEGAASVAMRADHPEDQKKRKILSKGVDVHVEEERVTVNVDVNLDYGRDFLEVADLIQREVGQAIKTMVGWEVVAVNVSVVGVNAP
jgi:uncharacterized alkaline shock family protein YloU